MVSGFRHWMSNEAVNFDVYGRRGGGGVGGMFVYRGILCCI